jgi:hypothetical protein
VSLESLRWNSAAVNAVHSGINATDALTVFMVGVRHAGERHEDAVTVLQSLNLPRSILEAKSHQLTRLLSIKNIAEYEDRLIKENEASEAVRNAKRYLEWVEGVLEK